MPQPNCGPLHFAILQYFGVHFASSLVVRANLMVVVWSSLLMACHPSATCCLAPWSRGINSQSLKMSGQLETCIARHSGRLPDQAATFLEAS